jgi:hypothetical protein
LAHLVRDFEVPWYRDRSNRARLGFELQANEPVDLFEEESGRAYLYELWLSGPDQLGEVKVKFEVRSANEVIGRFLVPRRDGRMVVSSSFGLLVDLPVLVVANETGSRVSVWAFMI